MGQRHSKQLTTTALQQLQLCDGHQHALGSQGPTFTAESQPRKNWLLLIKLLRESTVKALAAATIMATSLVSPPALTKPSVPAGYEYINWGSGTDTLFYGKVRAIKGNEVAFQMFSVEKDGSTNEWMDKVNCKQRALWRKGAWDNTFNKDSVGYDWIAFACTAAKLWKP